MSDKKKSVYELSPATGHCEIGEKIGKQYIKTGAVPVFSCEGACIRGEIARRAANMVAKQPGFGRACHGEVITIPDSAIAKWVTGSNKTILIDGCFLRCHGRIVENLLNEENLVQYDALSVYQKYCDVFDLDDVPEKEINEAAHQVAQTVVQAFSKGVPLCDIESCEKGSTSCCRD